MALVQCKECGGQVSTLAPACPHCGAPQTSTRTESPQSSTPPPIPAATPAGAALKRPASERITLTKAQASSPLGAALIEFLLRITQDGTLTIDEVRQLQQWLTSNDLAAIAAGFYLTEVVTGILADGQLEIAEAYELRSAIERVLPKEQRDEVSRKLARIERPASESQLEYIEILGGTIAENLTLSQASQMIETLLHMKPPTPRQVMVLRFWNRLDLLQSGKNGVSDWMDQWYSEDPDRQQAWRLYKRDTNDDGSQRNPERVPVGAGIAYLNRIKCPPLPSSKKSCLVLALAGCAVAVVVVLILRAN